MDRPPRVYAACDLEDVPPGLIALGALLTLSFCTTNVLLRLRWTLLGGGHAKYEIWFDVGQKCVFVGHALVATAIASGGKMSITCVPQ